MRVGWRLLTLQSRLGGSADRFRASDRLGAAAPAILRDVVGEAFLAWRRTCRATRHSGLPRVVAAADEGAAAGGLIALAASANPSAPSEE